MNLPNKLTILRIFMVPLLVVVLLTRYSLNLAALIFSLAALTDWLDGYIARSTDQITDLGKLLDPIADKLLLAAAFISLVDIGRAPAWMVVVIVGRELAITGLRSLIANKGIIIVSSNLGKYKTVSQIIAVLLLILNPVPHLGHISLWIALLLTLVSGVDYFLKTKEVILSSEDRKIEDRSQNSENRMI
ncbi:MAG: CDP-diacylglycerol--glycerol-3-phosphate 3-phosphatidyltransferase [Candidatus Schekmanbacteria bacterium]|nr:CDP-diacylglycerol--glycerol-3-phosphate 3-phosphatidyltransferase [Candidatus Schekmanbacteria bacterium]